MHGSNSTVNLKLTLQEFFDSELIGAGETIPVLYGRRDPATINIIDQAPKWMSFRLIDGGNWEPNNPALLQVLIFTRQNDDPYESEVDRLTDIVKDIFDISAGLPIKDYRVDRLNPAPVVDPNDETIPIKLNIRYYDMDEIPAPEGTNEMVNGRALSFRIWFWRHTKTGV